MPRCPLDGQVGSPRQWKDGVAQVNGMLDRLERLQKENHFLKAYLHSHNLLSLWHHQLQEQGKEPVDTSSIDIEVSGYVPGNDKGLQLFHSASFFFFFLLAFKEVKSGSATTKKERVHSFGKEQRLEAFGTGN